jgi:hypothetical protein
VQPGVRVVWVIRVLVAEKFSSLPPLLSHLELLVAPNVGIWKLRRLDGLAVHLFFLLTALRIETQQLILGVSGGPYGDHGPLLERLDNKSVQDMPTL